MEIGQEDTDLVRACLSGHAGAMRRLHDQYAPRVKAYFLRSGFAPADADDLVQDTFIRVVRSLRTFDSQKGRFSAWLASIARNVARKAFAAGKARPAAGFDPELAQEVLVVDDDPAGQSGDREEFDALRGCIASLSHDLADLVRMRYVEARTTRGIAAVAGLPEATVRLRLEQARELLKRCMVVKGFLS